MTINNIFKKIRERFQRTKLFLRKTALDELTDIVNFINSIGYLYGTEFSGTDWHFSKRCVLAACNIALIWSDMFYTNYTIFPSIDLILMASGMAFQFAFLTKFVFIIYNHTKFESLLKFVFKVYNENVTAGTGESILLETTTSIRRHCKYVFITVALAVAVYSFLPFYDVIVNGNLTLISPIELPYVDGKTVVGYLILQAFNIYITVVSIAFSFSFNFLFVVFVDVFGGLISLLEEELKTFDSLWEKKDPDRSIIEKRNATFRNILMKLMDLVRYNNFMNDLFSVCATVQIACSYIGTVIVLFFLLTAEFYGGMGGSVYFITEILMFCYIGQLLENSCERVATIIYNSKWYTYGTKYQKDFNLSLAIVQRCSTIRIAYIYPLNFMTGLMVVKSIYSLLMMMLSFLD